MKREKIPKVILCGNSTVGKTTFLGRLAKGIFEKDLLATTAGGFSCISYIHNNKTYIFNFWDTAGQEKYRSLIKIYFHQTNIALIVFDVTEPNSFKAIPEWIEQIRNSTEEDVFIILLANKIDLEEQRQIPKEDIQKASTEYGFPYIEVSSKTGDGTQELLDLLVTTWENYSANPEPQVQLQNQVTAQESSSCC